MKEAAFITELKVLDITEGSDTSTLQLLEPFQVYSAVLENIITVPSGFIFDGESIPGWLHGIAPPFGLSKRGAAVHDYLYRYAGFHDITGRIIPVSRKDADRVYLELVQAKGLPAWRSNLRYCVLRLVGWSAWNTNRKNEPRVINS